jgi:hypothetical protein
VRSQHKDVVAFHARIGYRDEDKVNMGKRLAEDEPYDRSCNMQRRGAGVKFCTAVNCMDGRVQLPVISYLKKRFEAVYIDVVTEPGPIKILADENDLQTIESIIGRISISIEKHGSAGVAIVGHHDCAGNPASRQEQAVQLEKARKLLSARFPGTEIIKLWVDKKWKVDEIE